MYVEQPCLDPADCAMLRKVSLLPTCGLSADRVSIQLDRHVKSFRELSIDRLRWQDHRF
ncbi:hypothetical protein NGR_c20330 [Sinorhizobium fredii NGR234]|uniref:Uncharacterized protein n=1 Tax=Sinorhizobium fredii (strain NBRC 101917 / NGR234) TaxID=394 RepID=C3MEC7_SINFN|nr:hypothetical protein NGR_c20330 [Sinorhizobium fredii NGR234]